ncbi:MAG TPA: phage baseplate assembly protein V [Nitrosopumilaceae archaeon]|nr:phage baseplate assembly protein V [Nitrosopumilaceae archaeon]
MIKIPILAVTILFFATMTVQEVYAPDITNLQEPSIGGKAIPDWVKSQFEWYVNGQIDEKTLLTSMNWMFDNNIMHLSEKAAQEVNELRMRNAELEKKISAISDKQYPDDKESGEEIYTDKYGRIKVQFPFDKTNKDEFASLAAGIYTEAMTRTQSSNMVWIPVIEDEVLVSFEDGDPDRPIIIGRVYNSDMMPPYKLPDGKMIRGMTTMPSMQTTTPKTDLGTMMKSGMSTSADRPMEQIAFNYDKISFATKTVDDIMTKGGTASAWKDGIAAFSQQGMRESVAGELQGIVVLCNTALDKKTQKIDAELKMIGEWLKIIEEKQATDAAGTTDYYGRTQTETKYQHNESDLDFITRKLSSIDQQIKSLDNGIMVLEEKLASVGDDAQMANIDLQNALQKQQQTLQTLSNVLKETHDTAKAAINNIRS